MDICFILWVIIQYCPNFVAQIVLALAIRSAFGLASVFSGHTHLVFGGLACFLTMQDAPSSSGVNFATVLDQLFLLGLLSRHVCAPTHVCTHIYIHVVSLSVRVCVFSCRHNKHLFISRWNLWPLSSSTAFALPFLPLSLLGACFPDSKTPVSHYPTSTFFSPVPRALFFFPPLFGN